MVLPALIRELGLEEEIRARDEARAVRGGERLADPRFEIVAPLIRGVDPGSRPQRQLGQRRRRSSPGGAVEESGRALAPLPA
jgi:hypothetical protein